MIYRLTVVDNNSPREMQNELLQLLHDGYISQLVILDKNIGLEPAKNIGLGFVKSDYFISTDNDCLPSKGWLPRLYFIIKRNPAYASISCRTQVMIGTGNIFDGHEDEEIVEFPHPGGSLRIMRTDVVKRVGGWRESMTGRGSEEKYISEKIHQQGFKTGFSVKIKTYHCFGKGNWGYPGNWKPEHHGHTPIWHPAIQNGDDENDINEWLK